MDKAMRYLIYLLLITSVHTSHAQEWTPVLSSPYTPLGFVKNGNGWRPGNFYFGVNPSDGSIWFAWDNYIHGFDAQGNYFKFDDSNVPVFDGNTAVSTIVQIGFTTTGVFAVDRYIGLMRYDGQDWTILSTWDYGNSISTDKDSIWVANDDFGYVTWKDGFTQEHNNPTQFDRIVSRNGDMWGSPGYDSGTIYRIDGVSLTPFYADSHGYLLDNSNISFKFSPVTDTLFTAGEKGISLMYGGAFIDTLTVYNTVNMPSGTIREIEIDQSNNIWALFGTDHSNHSSIAYYDFDLNTWTLIYNNQNSPIDWDGRVSIELDSQGNLYALDNTDLHVLKVNNWPQWLNTPELNYEGLTVYPNPSDGDIHVSVGDGTEINRVIIRDVHGRIISDLPLSSTIHLNCESGIYFVHFLRNNEAIEVRKVMIQ